MWKMLTWIIIGIVVLLLVYVRLAPSDPARWHRQAAISGAETKQLKGGYIWRKAIEGDGKAELAALDKYALATDRTERLVGSVEEGQMTYITRSKVCGFPDYTTVSLINGQDGQRILEIYGRLRFGRSDLGVNANRIKGWVAAAQL